MSYIYHFLRQIAAVFLLFLGVGTAFAQTDTARLPPSTGELTGKLVDGKNAPVSFATVTLLKMDSSVVNGDLTKDDGTFKITPTGLGRFLLSIESFGSTTRFIITSIRTDTLQRNLGNVKVTQSETTLRDVAIVGERPVMELKVDKKVFNVEKNTTTAGGSATDVLQNVPSVSVASDGTVSLRGKSDVTILIDGKPSTLLGSDVASALQSLPASSIESVEVLTNPSAKYDAQGTTGIINIITKKDARLGINGNFTLGAGTGDKYNGNFGLNVRKGKWNAFLNSGGRINNTYNNVTTERYDNVPSGPAGDTQFYKTYEHVPRKHQGSFNSIGFGYDPNKNNSFTFTENINAMGFGFKDESDYKVFPNHNEAGSPLLKQDRYTNFSVHFLSLSSAFDYKHKFKKKDEELTANATYSNNDIHRKQEYSTTNFYPSKLDSITSEFKQLSPATATNSSFTASADYTNPLFTKNGKLGLGFKSQLSWFKSDNSPTVESLLPQAATKFDSSILATYNYAQQIHAAYANWSNQVGKISYQAGLRLEDAEYNGDGNVPNYATFKNNFLNLFPSAFISYQLGHQQSVYVNYSKRTNRPGFMQLLPFKDLSNPGTVSMGNPGLLPEFIDNFEFSYSKSDNKGNNIIFSAYYAFTKNLIQKTPRLLSDSEAKSFGVAANSLFAKPINIASGATYGLEGTGHLQFTRAWDATVNLNFFQNNLIIGNIDTAYTRYLSDNSGFSWFGKANTSIKLPRNFSLQLNANYESPKVIAQGKLNETYWVDVALRKNLLKNKATIILNCSDIFKTHTLVTNYNLSTYNETINRVRETRILNLTFTYRFGKSDFGKNIATGGAGKPTKGMEKKDKPEKPNDEDRQKNLKEGGDDDQGGGGNSGPGGGKKDK